MAIDELHAERPDSAMVPAPWGWLRRVLSHGSPAGDVDASGRATACFGPPRRAAPNESMIVVVGLVQISAVLQFHLSSPRARRR